jgi:hypothetical protein
MKGIILYSACVLVGYVCYRITPKILDWIDRQVSNYPDIEDIDEH